MTLVNKLAEKWLERLNPKERLKIEAERYYMQIGYPKENFVENI